MIIPAIAGVTLFRNRKGAARKRFKRRSRRREQRAERQAQRQSVRKARIRAKGASGYWSPEAVASRSAVVGNLGSAAIQAGAQLGGAAMTGGASLMGDEFWNLDDGDTSTPPGPGGVPADDGIDPMLLIGGAAAAGLLIYLATRGKKK